MTRYRRVGGFSVAGTAVVGSRTRVAHIPEMNSIQVTVSFTVSALRQAATATNTAPMSEQPALRMPHQFSRGGDLLKFYFYGQGGRRGVEARARARRRARGWKKRVGGRGRTDDRPKEKREPSSSHFLRLSSPFSPFNPMPLRPHPVAFSVSLPRRFFRFARRVVSRPLATSLPPSLESRSVPDLAFSLRLILSTSF